MSSPKAALDMALAKRIAAAEDPRDPEAALDGDPICRAIDRLPLPVQCGAEDARVLYRLADRIGEIGSNGASDIAARLCEIAAKLEGRATA